MDDETMRRVTLEEYDAEMRCIGEHAARLLVQCVVGMRLHIEPAEHARLGWIVARAMLDAGWLCRRGDWVIQKREGES